MANRGSISTGYDIDNSVKLEADNNEWFYNASPTAGNRRTFTFSFWIKRSALGTINASGTQYVAGQGQHGRMFFSGDYFQFRFDDGHDVRDMTTKHRDTAAWLHVVVAVDTNQVSSSNRVKIYFNGVQTTTIDFDGGSYPDIEDQGAWFNTNYLTVGTGPFGGSYSVGDGDYDMRGYLADFAAVDGTQYAPTDFGEFDEDSGIWKPKDLSDITWGDEGFYLKFDDSSSLGADSSGNSNNLTENNIAAADQSTDTPTNNFAIGNVLTSVGGFLVPSEGATRGTLSTSGPGNNTGGASLFSTIPVSNGKWYFEAQNTNGGDVYLYLGVGDVGGIENWGIDGEAFGQAGGPSVAWRGGGAQDGKVYINNVATGSADTWETEVVGVALDLDNNKVYFHKSGTYINSGDPAGGTDNGGQYDLPTAVDDQWCIGVAAYNLATWELNFGGYTAMSISSAASDANDYGTFEYAPPSGYYALCTKNLAEFGG